MLAQSQTGDIVYSATRFAEISGWWTWAAVVTAVLLAIAASIWLYRRDAAELPRRSGRALSWLRLVTIAALIVFFLDINQRTRKETVRPSEVAILVDGSQSMSLPTSSDVDSPPRLDRVKTLVSRAGLPEVLSRQHRTSIYTTGSSGSAELVGTIEAGTVEVDGAMSPNQRKTDAESAADGDDTSNNESETSGPSVLAWLAGAILVLGLIASIGSVAVAIGLSRDAVAAARSALPNWILAAAILIPIGIATLGLAASIHAERSLASLFVADGDRVVESESTGSELVDAPEDAAIDWDQALAASTSQSRIGDAIRSVLGQHDPTTMAGLIVATDGQNNGGVSLAAAASAAARSEIRVIPIGLGTDTMPTNVRVVDLDVPKRVYPGDKFVVDAVLQASGPSTMTVDVQLLDELDTSGGGEGGDQATDLPSEVIETKRITLPPDGSLSTLRFEVEPEQVGRRRMAVRVVAPPRDTQPRDDSRIARYEVVSRRLKVLAIAGGPTREYRFVRNLLFRDESVQLDVFLQTGRDGISQDADNLLAEIPAEASGLFQYDAIMMFDPRWDAIELAKLQLLERYLAQQAGGLILIAGPVYHNEWIRRRTDPRTALIASFFPVTFSTGSPIATGGRAGGQRAWPLKLTDEASRSDFMDLADDASSVEQIWDQFDGVYDYVSVKSTKPAAKVYAYFSDPTTEIGGSLPVFLASQFYGAGRVMFAASGEFWRLRGVEESFFDAFYTKLVRWVAQGRLQRDGKRGVLLVDNPRAMVGDTIVLRAILVDETFEPLTDASVTAKVLVPDGSIDELELTPVPGEARPGTYGGRYVVRRGGDYEFRLTLGDALNEEVLRQGVSVRLPTIELERPRRNDDDLRALADATGGFYVPVDDGVVDTDIVTSINDRLEPQPQVTVLPGTPNVDFARRRNAALLWLIATALTMEWMIRRLHRLA